MGRPRSASGWTMAVFGALAAVMGVVGLTAPDVLLALLGFGTTPEGRRADGDYTAVFMAASSMASLNMGVYYLLASMADWRRFFAWTVPFRLLTFTVFTLLVVAGTAPARFWGVGLWEGLGALATGIALWRERKQGDAVPAAA